MSSSESFDSTRPAGGDPGRRADKPEPATDRKLPERATAGGKAPGANGPAAPPQDPLMGAELGGCRIDALLGRGAMGAVYKAKQLRLDREVAVKVIRTELLSDPRALKRFEQEARTVGRFSSPHVVMVHDVGFERGVHFLVMELVRGKNLRDYVGLLAGGRMPVAEALPLLRQACKGLEEAQRLAVLHRDIKPDNLMLTERGVLKIADFGIAKPVQDDFSLTMTSELIGTPLYMSPEQCQAASDLDFRSDMYSLGATFYYLLTGEPPIKATSVYELLQTKTKLEHLSLWKALPELDENHPLSRVIERMTALERGDRYQSYEALLEDLMLVQQGRTMEIQRTRSRQGKAGSPPRKSARAVAALVFALLVLGGGGAFAWQQWGPGQQQQQHQPDDAGARLAALRVRFAESGPSPGLRDEVAAVAAGSELAARDTLLVDLDAGLQIKERLHGVARPASPALPFADLREHFARVDTAAATSGTPGPELLQWRTAAIAGARAEGELGAMATSALESAFATWQGDRLKAGGDSKLIAGLAERLTGIGAARANLLELLPKLADTVQQRLSAETLAAARNGLTVEAVPDVVDVSVPLAEIRGEYAVQGPIASLLNRVEALRPTSAEQIEQRSKLLDEFQKAGRVLEAARGARLAYPPEPQLPFADVANFFVAIDRELQPLQQAEGGLPVWAAKERTELRDEPALQGKVVQRCRSTFLEWQQRRAQPAASPLQLTALQTDLTALRDGITKASELFPGAAAELAALVPAEVVAAASKDIGLATRRLAWLGDVRETARKYGIVQTLAVWRTQAGPWTADLARHHAGSSEFAADAEVQSELQRAEENAQRWRDADARVTELGNTIGVGDLLGATEPSRPGPAGDEGAPEWKALRDAAGKALEAFTVLDGKLDFTQALAGLGAAKTGLQPLRALVPTAPARLERWTSAVQSLQRAASGMVPITGGRTKQSPDDVAPFFLSRTEATQADYQRFLDELHTQVSGFADPQAQLEACKARLGDLVLPANVLAGMLERRTKLRAPASPIDSVCCHEALAYSRWFQLSLPTEGEWALAAFGDGNRFPFPWGSEWKDEDNFRNIGPALVDATSGGRSWRSENGVVVHHLAGNAAEWLQPAPGATEGKLAGGRFNDTRQEQRKRAAGEGFHAAPLSKQLPGFGFRTILRVRDYLAPHFTNGYPVRAR